MKQFFFSCRVVCYWWFLESFCLLSSFSLWLEADQGVASFSVSVVGSRMYNVLVELYCTCGRKYQYAKVLLYIYYIYDSLWGSCGQICKQFLVLAIVVNEFENFGISCIYGAQLLLSHLKKTLLNIFTLDNSDVAYSSSVHPIYIRPSLSSLAISNWATYVANCKMLWYQVSFSRCFTLVV